MPAPLLQDASAGGASEPLLVGAEALDDLPDGVLVVRASGVVETANLAFLGMIGRGLDEVRNQPIELLVAEEDILRFVGFDAMFGVGPVLDGHVIFSAGDGSLRPLVVCACAARDGKRVFITTRASGVVQRELADASRWVALEQERTFSVVEARDALAAKNEALRAAQAELQLALTKLQDEVKTRERLEHELTLAQRLEAIGQLAAGVAHEINTPLQYVGDSVHFLGQAFQRIHGYLARVDELANDEHALGRSEPRAALGQAQKAARLAFLLTEIPKALSASNDGIAHVSTIVQALKSFSHVDQDEMGQNDINAGLQNTLVMARNEYKSVATLVTDLGELPLVTCSIGKLNQVFLNLLINAAHAIADAKRTELGTIRVSSRALSGMVEVSIADDGCGIPEEIRHKIFEQFFTTKVVGRGTGQGLALARRIVVEVHGGHISFESEAGKGTVFTLRIPVARSAQLSNAALQE